MSATARKEIIIALVAAVGIVLHIAARYLFHVASTESAWPLLAVLAAGGIPLLIDLLRRVAKGEFGADLLAGISIVVSALLGQYLAGAIVVLMLSGGTALEQSATRRASAALGALARRMPSTAHLRKGTEIEDIALDSIQPGDLLVVFPHEICPVDGIIHDGSGTMDESYLTGEPFQISKVAGSVVLSGAVNGDSALTIETSRMPVDSRYAKIMRVMREAETNRPKVRRIADRLGAWYTVLALVVAAAAWIAGRDPTRFLAVLVIATPCPLLLAVPVAIIGAISLAASRAIVIGNPSMLELVGACRTMIFDKTGTLTGGRPRLTDVFVAPAFSRDEAVGMAASLEQYSRHPLAAGILESARQSGIALSPVARISEKPGEGLRGTVGDASLEITSRTKIRDASALSALPPASSGMECILLVNGVYAATLRFHDAPRAESRRFVNHLAPHHGVERLILLSGDRESEVLYLAEQVGIGGGAGCVFFGKSPEEKVAIVKEESRRAPTLFVGDGINDAPAMQAATVGVALGQNSDITSEAADAVVLEPSLRRVDELIHIGRRMRRIALQSAVGGMALSIAGMLIAAAGYLPPVAGAIAQEAIDIAAVLNALRVAIPGRELEEEF